ncbi:hypothetical protein MtrunA17_Chr7g0238151 [Medicago truncatula]|uniref:DUF247 domain protein n=1 Tax=Medicago truncatula TaxID=3880 RepID=A0A396GYI3_MEDTR|nr:uncharacterized protein LOC25498465 [Medicago truncatula]RHN46060.1 hypothetical protein MtrunA17_Chr7g0238151 [Medicago truncatula]
MASQTIKEKFVELQKSMQTPQNSRPKIQRVVDRFRNRTNFEKHYSPKFVSLGPIHHDNPNLKKGEKYKLMWAAKYIENTRHIPEDLHKKIADNIDELKGHFDNDVLASTSWSLEGFGSLEEKLSWMLFVDGCSLLHILERAKLDEPGQMNIKVDQLVLVMMDVLLLENQLPYQVLKLLWKDEDQSGLIKSMMNFLACHHWATPDESQSEKKKDMVPKRKAEREHSLSIRNESQLETPFHLLDLQRNIILITSTTKLLCARLSTILKM